jgi:hypothetical protein
MNNTPPNCRICQQPLTINELDSEPGTDGEFHYFSSHYACISPAADGRYIVQSSNLDQSQVRQQSRFNQLVRAQEQVEDLARYNRPQSIFSVVDSTTGEVVYGLIGELQPR